MKEQAAQVADLAPRVWKIHAELCDVQAQLANPALSEEEKAGLREVEQQRMASQQLWSERLKAEQDKQIQLLTVLQQLLDKHKDLRAERAAQLNGLEQLQQQLTALPDPSDLADSSNWSETQTHGLFRLCAAMANSFDNQASRMVEFSEMFQEYLGERIDPHSPIPGSKFATDGSLLCQVGPACQLPVYIQQVKLEIGTQGDPFFQGQRHYQLGLANPELAALVRDTVLPVLFLELVGPHLRVSAMASPADVTVVCEPLTPYLHLFSMHRCQPDHMIRLALVLRALKRGIRLLKDAWSRPQQPTAASPAAERSPSPAPSPSAAALASAAGPAPSGASASTSASTIRGEMEGEALRGVVPLRDPSLQLPYPLRPGTAFTDVQPFEPAGVFHPLYFAMYKDGKTQPPPPPLPVAAGGAPQHAASTPAASVAAAAAPDPAALAVVVKFSRMSADAVRVHRAWAAAGLAPQVVLEQVLPCGLTMLVMERLAAEDGWVMFYSLPQDQKQQLDGAVVAALDRAHAVVVDAERGLPGVHADLRQANVMAPYPVQWH
eukprot:XP_001702266.1 predicted protein [Chlamydomonas reinhardtii]